MSGRDGNTRRGDGGGDEVIVTCNYCKKPGHRIPECPKVKQKEKASGKSQQHSYRASTSAAPQQTPEFTPRIEAVKCFICGEFGHKKWDCPQNRGDSRQERAGTSQSFREKPQQLTPQQLSITRDVKPFKVEDKDIKRNAKSIFVKRPDFGTKGKPIEVIANHFRLRIPNIIVFQYRIEIKPQSRQPVGAIGGRDARVAKVRKLNRKELRDVFNHFVANTPELFGQRSRYPVYDGDLIMISSQKLAHDLFEKNVEISSESDQSITSKYKINVQFTGKIDLNEINLYYDGIAAEVQRSTVQAIEIILKHGSSNNRIPIGNSLYPKDSDNLRKELIDRFNTKFLSYGHYQSMHLSQVCPTLNVDRSCTAFHISGSLVKYIETLLSDKFGKNIDINNFDLIRESRWLTNQLKNLRIYTTHLKYNRQYTIKEVNKFSANKIIIPDLNISVAQFFKNQHKKEINGRFPCIKPNGGKDVYLPIEMCYVSADQPVSRAMLAEDGNLTSQMVRKCGSQKPIERFNEIYSAVENIAVENKNNLNEFQLKIDKRPLLVKARIIDKPKMDPQIEDNIRKLYQTVPLRSWLVVNLSSETSIKYKSFIKNMTDKAETIGFEMSQPFDYRDISLQYDYDRQLIPNIYEEAIEETRKRGGNVQLIVFILPKNKEIHGDIKLNGDTYAGIVTQCILSKNVIRPPSGIFYNLLLKINAKLGGINKILKDLPDKPDILRNRVMIIGADVTHPAPGSKLVSSVAACVASYDNEHCCYAASIRIQDRSSGEMQCSTSSGQESKPKAQEMIKDFDKMVKELLDIYRKENDGHLPDHIIYYRDGVSESQFSQVLKYEDEKLSKACDEFNIQPMIIIMTAQKRHRTRFIPSDRINGDKNGNILPGTIVDTHVTHPADYDFFLNSHNGIQGTNRPTHYYVLRNDHELGSDELQKLTYYLCYTYARCEKPISIPSPVQYAHLAAYRARNHIVAHNLMAEKGLRYVSDDMRRERERNLVIKVKEPLINRMYYC